MTLSDEIQVDFGLLREGWRRALSKTFQRECVKRPRALLLQTRGHRWKIDI